MRELKHKKHITKGICAALRCNNRCGNRTLCSTHRSQLCRQRDAVRYAYNNMRNRARRKNIPCTITLEQFRLWCHKVTYIGFKGRSPEGWTIDRKYNDVGYHIDNIQAMQNQDNVKKYFTYDWRTKQVYQLVYPETASITADLPF